MALQKMGPVLTLKLSAAVDEEYLIAPYRSVSQIDARLCWAACITSAIGTVWRPQPRRVSQREIARQVACPNLSQYNARRCNKWIKVSQVASVWTANGFIGLVYKELDISELGAGVSAEIAERRPVQAYVDNRHVVMIYGYRIRGDDSEEVLVMDPMRGVRDQWRDVDDSLEWKGLWTGIEQGVDDA